MFNLHKISHVTANEGLKNIVHPIVKVHRHLSRAVSTEKTSRVRVHTALLDSAASCFISPLLRHNRKHRYLLLQQHRHTRKSLLK